MCTKTQEGPQKINNVLRPEQDRIDIKSDVNGRGVVSIRFLRKAIYGRFWIQVEIKWIFEVTYIEERGTYKRSQVKGWTDLTPLA